MTQAVGIVFLRALSWRFHMRKILFFPHAQSSHQETLCTQLSAEGYELAIETSDESTWADLTQSHQPDLILLEVLPDSYVPHFQFCHQIRQDTLLGNLPIIILGSTPTPALSEHTHHYLYEGLHAGANDYLKAPYDMQELVCKINTALRLSDSLEKARSLADQLNSVNDELSLRNIQVEKELYIARQLQQSLLPPACVSPSEDEEGPIFTKVHYQDEKVRISGIYLPCDALGGDLYDVLKFKDNAIGISITDVSGHGVPAGFITAIFKTSLYRLTHQLSTPSEVMFHLNNELFDIVKTGDYVTSIYMRLNLDNLELECSGAGHPYPFWYQAKEDAMERLQKNGTPLVWVRDIDYPMDKVQLHAGDKVYLFTDGVSELRNPQGEMFGEARIESVLREGISQHAPYLTDHLITTLSDFTEGAPLEDDISMMLIEIL